MSELLSISGLLNSLSFLHFAEWGILLHLVVVVALIIRILWVQKNTGIAIAWLTIMFAIPIIGVIGYILIGEPTIGRRYQQRSERTKKLLQQIPANNLLQIKHQKQDTLNPLIDQKYTGLSQFGETRTGFAASAGHKLQLLTDVDVLFDKLIADINHANQLILMEFYIVYPKGRVLEVFEALKAAAKRGVECYLLADSVGSFGLFSGNTAKNLEAAGIEVHQSMPVGLFKTLFKRTDVRNHRKIVVIDDSIGYTGSFNLVDPRYFKQDKNLGQWVDVAMRVKAYQQNSVVAAMAGVIVTDIGAESRTNFATLQERVNSYTRRLNLTKPAINDVNNKASVLDTPDDDYDTSVQVPNQPAEYNVVAQLIPSAPQMTAHVIYNTLVNAIHRADKKICITTPYFVPDESLMGALTTASRRGVAVTLIIPKKVDFFFVQHASQAFYQELLEAGVTIALFDAGLLHAKTVVIDDSYCLFGTVNMDMRSFYLNMEVSLAIYSPKMVAHVAECQQTYLQYCEIMSLESWQIRPGILQVFDNGIRLFSPLL